MIQRLDVKNYRCLREVSCTGLTPIHAFIGPNDSGKSTLLGAVRVLSDLASNANVYAPSAEAWKKDEPITLRAVTPEGSFNGQWLPNGDPQLSITENPAQLETSYYVWNAPAHRDTPQKQKVWAHLKGWRLLRLDPDSLRRPSGLIPFEEPIDFADQKGARLPGVYDAIRDRHDEKYREIVDSVARLFPAVRTFSLQARSSTQKIINFELRDGRVIPAEQASEGLLYYLAFAAIQSLTPMSFLLIEEPENGLHPARIADVVKMLRTISSAKTQVFIATHSPLVINELTGDEVTIVTRDPDTGTKVKLLKDTANFREREKVYANGELWVSYANGQDEKGLLEGP